MGGPKRAAHRHFRHGRAWSELWSRSNDRGMPRPSSGPNANALNAHLIVTCVRCPGDLAHASFAALRRGLIIERMMGGRGESISSTADEGGSSAWVSARAGRKSPTSHSRSTVVPCTRSGSRSAPIAAMPTGAGRWTSGSSRGGTSSSGVADRSACRRFSSGRRRPCPKRACCTSRQFVANARPASDRRTTSSTRRASPPNGFDPEVFDHLSDELVLDASRAGLFHRFNPANRMAASPLSRVNVEPRARGVSLQTYHTFPDERAIVRTQSLFELRPPRP